MRGDLVDLLVALLGLLLILAALAGLVAGVVYAGQGEWDKGTWFLASAAVDILIDQQVLGDR